MILRRGYVYRKFNTPTNVYTYMTLLGEVIHESKENIIIVHEAHTAYCFEIRTQNIRSPF